MKPLLFILLIVLFYVPGIAQKTLLVEKTGKAAKYYYHKGDKIKFKVAGNKKTVRGTLGQIGDSTFLVQAAKSDTIIRVTDIQCVYKQFVFPKKFGMKLIEFGGVIFAVMVFNNLINNSPAFNPYVFIVSGSFIASGGIFLAFTERPCKIGVHWKVKILEVNLK